LNNELNFNIQHSVFIIQYSSADNCPVKYHQAVKNNFCWLVVYDQAVKNNFCWLVVYDQVVKSIFYCLVVYVSAVKNDHCLMCLPENGHTPVSGLF